MCFACMCDDNNQTHLLVSSVCDTRSRFAIESMRGLRVPTDGAEYPVNRLLLVCLFVTRSDSAAFL